MCFLICSRLIFDFIIVIRYFRCLLMLDIFRINCLLVSFSGICVVMVFVRCVGLLMLFSDVSIFGGIFLFSLM